MGLTFIDWFAGVGGFRKGMENAGHKCIGFCEFDKYAVASYTSMHLITEEQREYLAALDMKKRQKEILKEEYRNGEWYAEDVRTVRADEIPRADCWCFGFPCQDISVAGKQLGFAGHRSSLFFAVTKLIRDTKEEDRPQYLFIENVKNLLSVNRGFDFAKLLVELDEIGYDCEWQLLNSKDFGVPQNRERVFIVGHLRGRSGQEVFPVQGADGEDRTAVSRDINQIGKSTVTDRENPSAYRVYGTDGIAPTLTNMAGGGREPHILVPVNGDKEVYAIWHEKLHRYIAIRKLTPKECFRLQGWDDESFQKAEFVNSNSQLYKQAGNGVTVNVIEAIARKMA
jgi:DNA (cytosine-5)-methyltransferase 1